MWSREEKVSGENQTQRLRSSAKRCVVQELLVLCSGGIRVKHVKSSVEMP